jgi:hypothetical protein
MPANALSRDAIVKALDDLGERDGLSYAERTSGEAPYPPSFVADRLKTLRRDLWWTKRFIFGLIIFVGIAAWLGMEGGWGRPVFAYVGLLLVPQIPTISRLVRDAKAEQLYSLLHQLEGEQAKPESAPPEPA